MDSPVVCLNVAGCYFTTARETVLREPASKLALQVRGVLPTLKDDAGHVFIDRDPRFFQAILNYLRDGWALLPSSASERRELMQEVRFYQVRSISHVHSMRVASSASRDATASNVDARIDRIVACASELLRNVWKTRLLECWGGWHLWCPSVSCT